MPIYTAQTISYIKMNLERLTAKADAQVSSLPEFDKNVLEARAEDLNTAKHVNAEFYTNVNRFGQHLETFGVTPLQVKGHLFLIGMGAAVRGVNPRMLRQAISTVSLDSTFLSETDVEAVKGVFDKPTHILGMTADKKMVKLIDTEMRRNNLDPNKRLGAFVLLGYRLVHKKLKGVTIKNFVNGFLEYEAELNRDWQTGVAEGDDHIAQYYPRIHAYGTGLTTAFGDRVEVEEFPAAMTGSELLHLGLMMSLSSTAPFAGIEPQRIPLLHAPLTLSKTIFIEFLSKGNQAFQSRAAHLNELFQNDLILLHNSFEDAQNAQKQALKNQGVAVNRWCGSMALNAFRSAVQW